jgi:acetate kinase
MNVLVPNLGSTSLKYQVLEMPAERTLARGRFERVSDYRAAIRQIPLEDTPVDVVAFKAVHAGAAFRGVYVIDAQVEAAIERFLPAAPAHNTIYLTGIRAFREALPSTALVAAFETAFHSTMPEYAARYGVPRSWREDDEIRRYGFHGASHEYAAARAPEILGRAARRLVNCHLGGSSSMCAILDGRSVDTTMGFSPQSGLENATRHGDLDVFAVLTMMERHGWDAEEVRRQLTKTGGLAGLSGVDGGDMRDIEAAASAGNGDAALAIELFAYQVRKTIGAYAAAMSGLDAIAFTGGIGENSPALRRAVCAGLEFLGVSLDAVANESGAGDRVVSPESAAVGAVVLTANEELIVARRAFRLLSG